LRYVPTLIFAAALIAPSAVSVAAPRTIDDCEKIQAADAYNLCLASFGPVAHTHGAAAKEAKADASADDVEETEPAAAAPPRHGHARAHGHSRHHGSRRAWAKHGHGHGQHAKAIVQRHGKRVAFTVVSGHTRLR